MSLLRGWLAELRFTRILAAVLLANLASLVVLNSFGLRPAHLLVTYPLALGGFGWLLAQARVRRARLEAPGWLIGCALAFALFLTVPRLPYLLEWLPGNTVLAQADDWGRLSELVSMTLSERYPLRHFANQDYLFSHYYTALYPMAFFKTCLPVLTLKDAIVAGNALYHLLLALSLLEVALRWFASLRRAALFYFLCTLFGGFDWLFHARQLFSHAEFWPREVFGAKREISSYFTGMYWVVHHFTAFYSVAMALALARNARFRRRAAKPALLGLLLIGAFYSSVFAVAPVLLLGLPEVLRLVKHAWRTRVLPLLLLVLAAPLFLYANRVQGGAFSWTPLRLGWSEQPALDFAVTFAAYLLLVSLVDLGGIPLLLCAWWRRFGRTERRYLAGALSFLASTYAVESFGYNNYSMRGMFLPTLILFYLFSTHVPDRLLRAKRPAIIALALVACFGTLREWVWLGYQPLMHSYWYWGVRGKAPPPQALADLRPFYRDLARDRTTSFYAPSAGDLGSPHKYNAEKMIRGLPVGQMLESERELLRNPRRNWFW